MVRSGTGVLALLCALLPARQAGAQEDAAAREVAEGEKLAKAGLFAESIARFKAAEARAPHARHDCLIALSYFRLKKLGQAQLFMQRCAARATGADPAPSWVVPMGNDVRAAIAAADLSAVTIAVKPAEARSAASVRCSAFEEDETFGEATIHLPPGEHTIRAAADGYAPIERTVAVGSRAPLAIELTFEPAAASPSDRAPATVRRTGPAALTASSQPAAEPPGRGPWPYVALGVGGAALVGGVAMHLKALSTKEDAESSIERYQMLKNDYASQKTFTYTLYTVAVIGGAVGAWLWFRGPPDDGGFHASAAATPEGAFVTFGWDR